MSVHDLLGTCFVCVTNEQHLDLAVIENWMKRGEGHLAGHLTPRKNLTGYKEQPLTQTLLQVWLCLTPCATYALMSARVSSAWLPPWEPSSLHLANRWGVY